MGQAKEAYNKKKCLRETLFIGMYYIIVTTIYAAVVPFVNGKRFLESASIKHKEDRNPGSNPDLELGHFVS